MDPGLHFRVLRRFKFLVAIGIVLAAALAFLAVMRVNVSGSPHLKYRQYELWQGYTTLIVSPQGFPWGKTNPSPDSNPANYGTLALVYSKLVTSDAVKRIVAQGGPIRGKITATYVSANPSNPNGIPLPLISVAGTGVSARAATELAQRTSQAFLRYLAERAASSGIPQSQRVSVSILNRAESPMLLQGRSKTLPIVIFLVVLMATFALAFALEKARPSLQVLPAPELAAAAARRSA